MRTFDLSASWLPRAFRVLAALALALAVWAPGLAVAAVDDDVDVALSVASLLRSARTVISTNQDRINDPKLGDKGLSGDVVVRMAVEANVKSGGLDPQKIDPASRQGQLLSAMISAIKEVMTANQKIINEPGVGFKGFVPAVFGRLVTEQFRSEVGAKANIKVTAPPELVRNRKAAPDEFETRVIKSKFQSPNWPTGKVYSEKTTEKGRPATRVLVPEYYGVGCLSCHGNPKGAIDITGYPKEGANLNDLGGVISISLFH